MTVAARPSATVVLVRPANDSWETYLLRRSAQSPVLAELWVFPGGTVRADDLEATSPSAPKALTPVDAHATFSRPPDVAPLTAQESYGHFVAATRELIEEAGVVLTSESTAVPAASSNTSADFLARREALEHGSPLAEFVRATGVTLDLDQLIYYAHWITPEGLPQRFDTRFFLAHLPEGQEASPSSFEMMDGLWVGAAEALERAHAGSLPLHFATVNHLRRLAPFTAIDELFAFGATKPVIPVMPNIREKDGRKIPFLPPEIEGAW